MIHLFHGFLGGPEDFARLGDLPECRIYDLYHDDLPTPAPEDVLIGYSMGGRVALELAEASAFKKLILINAHPGLSNSAERMSRRSWEDDLLKRMQTMSFDDFMIYWNGLEIFAHDPPIGGRRDLYARSRELFDEHRLSEQKDYIPFLIQAKERVQFIIGEKDRKYVDLAKEKLIPNGIPVTFISGGHRLLMDPGPLNEVLEKLI